MEHGEKISLAEKRQRREEDRTYERRVELRESTVEIRQRMVVSEDKSEVSSCYSEEQQLETFEFIDAESQEEEDGDADDEALDQSFVSPPSKESRRDETPPPEKTCCTKKDISHLTSKRESLVYKNTTEEREVEQFVLKHHEETEEETFCPVKDLVKISARAEGMTRQPEEVENPTSVSPPPHQDLPQILPKSVSLPLTVVPSKQVRDLQKPESPPEEIITTSKAAGKMNHEDFVPLEIPAPVSEEVSLEEQPVLSTVLPPVPSPEKVSLPSKDSLLPEKTSLALPKAVPGLEEDFPNEVVSLLKKSTTKDKVASSNEARSTINKPQSTQEAKKPKKETEEAHQGIPSYLSCTG